MALKLVNCPDMSGCPVVTDSPTITWRSVTIPGGMRR